MPNSTTPSFVYLIASDRAIKIGVSDNPRSRLKALQTAHYLPLELIYTIACPSKENAQSLEALLHERYKEYHLSGEWFFVGSDVIVRDLEFLRDATQYFTGIAVHKTEEIEPSTKVFKRFIGELTFVIAAAMQTVETFRKLGFGAKIPSPLYEQLVSLEINLKHAGYLKNEEAGQ